MDARYSWVAGVQLQARPELVLNPEEIYRSQDFDEIAARLGTASLEVDPSHFALTGGLRLRF